MEEDVMERPIVIDERRQEVVQELMRNVYMWMTGGLALLGEQAAAQENAAPAQKTRRPAEETAEE